jgi:phosphoribosylformylglycinamidine synthase
VGKDSLSMRTRWGDGTGAQQVTAPVSLIVTAFATLDDVRGTLTPQLQTIEPAPGSPACGDTTLVLIDLGAGKRRLGGSMLAQVLGQFGDHVPDLDDPQALKSLVTAVNELRGQGRLLAYHDRSDGGLWASVCEMAFAGRVGVTLNLDMLSYDPLALDVDGNGTTDVLHHRLGVSGHELVAYPGRGGVRFGAATPPVTEPITKKAKT